MHPLLSTTFWLSLVLLKKKNWEGFPGGAGGKELPTSAGDKRHRFDPWSGRSPGGGHSNPLQYSSLESPMDRVAKSQTRLSAGGFQWFLCSGPDPGILPLHSLWSSGNFFHFPDLIMFSITVLTWTAQPGICFSSLSALVTTVCPSELKYHYQRLSLILQSILLSSLYSSKYINTANT